VTIHLDTSFLVHALTGRFVGLDSFEQAVGRGDRLRLSTLVLFEWLRGPRTEEELLLQERFAPAADAISLGVAEARTAAKVYRALSRARRRDVDIAIAACAIEHDAALWTLNPQDFKDIPGLRLYK
jgi:predicted nucleic acid-binding protein